MSAGAASGAAAAAAAKRRREQEEEEQLTSYRESDLNDDWEFKILRSMTSAFKNPDKLRQTLAEEAQAGWVLVEKFDNGRLRLKRPASRRRATTRCRSTLIALTSGILKTNTFLWCWRGCSGSWRRSGWRLRRLPSRISGKLGRMT